MDIKKLARIADDSVESREIIKALTKLKELGYKVARVSNNLIISYGTIEMRLRLLTGDYTVKLRNGDLKGTLDVGGKSFAFNLMKILKRLIYDERVSDSIDTDLLLTIVEAQLKHYNLDVNYSARKIGNKVSVKNSSGVEQGSIWEDNDEIKTQFNASTDPQVKTALEEISQLGPNVVKDKDGKVKEAFKESYSKITGALKGIATIVSKEVGKDIKENAVAIAGPIGVIANELYKAGKSGMKGKKSDSFSIHICDAMSSSVLKDKIKALGLDPDGKSVKEMEQVIAMALWAQNHPGEEFPDQFDPMLAKDSTKATKDWINENFKDTDWILQEKINGMRSILTLNGDKVRMTSRSKSVSDFLFTPHQDSVLGFQDIKNPFKGKTVLDGELFSKRTKIDTGQTVTESPLQAVVALVHMNAKESLEIQEKYNGPLVYKCFDILYFNGDDVQDLPYEERDKLAGTAIEMLRHDNPDLPIQKVDSVTSYKSAWEIFQQYVKEGKEGCFEGHSRVMMADGSFKRIDSLKEGEYVMSWSNERGVEPKKIINVFDNGLKPLNEWCTVYHGLSPKSKGGKSSSLSYQRILMTKKHKIFEDEYKPVSESEFCHEYDYEMDDFRKQAILGWILSDGFKSKQGNCSLCQKVGDYLEYTKSIFSSFCQSTDRTYISGKGSLIGRINLLKRHTTWTDKYHTGEKQDYVKICEDANEIALAYALMGDGSSYGRNKTSITFSLESFDKESIEAFVNLLKRFGINSSVELDKRVVNGAGLEVKISGEDKKKLVSLIGKYVHPCMKYKLGGDPIEEFIQPKPVNYGIVKRNLIVDSPSKSKYKAKLIRAWDIEVEDNHNYFVEGVLVHNCMMKKRSMKYKQGNRSSEMQKLKGFVTVDGFITGAVKSSEGKGFKDLIGGFKISAYVDGKEQEIAAVSNIPNSVRKEATVMVDGKPTLNPEYLDKCVELIGQEFGKNKRLGSARINEWRPDKDPMDCQLTEADVTPKDWEKNDVKDSKVADSKIFDASIDVDNVVAEVMTKWINSGHTNDITTNSNYPFLKFNLPPHNGVVEVNFEDQTVNLSKDYKAEGDFGELYVIVKESVDDVLQIEPDYEPSIQMSDSFDMEFFTDFLNTNWNGPKLKFREDDNVIKVGFEKYEPFIFEYDAEEKKFTDLKSINSIASMKLIEMAQNHLNPISDSLEDVQDQAIYLIDWLKSIGELSMTFDMDYEDIFVNSSSKNYNAVLQRLEQLDLIYEILDDGTIKITLPVFSTAEYEGVYDSDEKYSVKKVNNTKYEVLKDGEHTYDLEKKGSKWTCSCIGFKYRGKCKHLNLLDEELPKRHPRKELDDLVPEIKEMFKDYPTWEIVGSYRRGKSDFKDIDILVETDSSEFKKIEDILQQDPEYKRTMAGPDIIRGTYHGYDFDVSRVEPGNWIPALLYRTGSKETNIKMRGRAKALGMRLNEKGLWKDGEKIPNLNSEKDYFDALGMEYLEPEER